MKKKRVVIGVIFSIFIISAIIYLAVSLFYQYHFLKGSVINGVDCSNMSVDAVTTALKNDVRYYYLEIKERNNTVEHLSSADIKMSIEIKGDLDKLKKSQNNYLWFIKPEEELKIDTKISYDEEALRSAINELDCINTKKMTSEKVPYINYQNGKYTIEDGVPSTETDVEKTVNVLEAAIKNKKKYVDLEKEGCYIKDSSTAYVSDNPDIKKLVDTYMSSVITLDFGEKKEIIDKELISKWISFDQNGNIVFNQDGINEYLNDLALKYNTIGKVRMFKNHDGDIIRISGGDYGYVIDRETELNNIINDIKSGTSITREVACTQKAFSHEEEDYGSTYIEADLANQKLYAYSDGSLILDTDMVSGDPIHGRATPVGIYNLRFTFTDYEFIRGDFKKILKYWMVFYGNSAAENIGIASCDFLENFGGNVYKHAGSLGSIYISEEDAKVLYTSLPRENIAVIIYNNK